ncbi:MAG TPA: hypothetical protein VLC53_05155 [Myxococcota bacterium]|nr:hypothetical protein [Myxococcota bacterium]
MKARTDLRRSKLPPILEIDEDGIPVSEHESWGHPRWNGEDDVPGVQMGDWPTDFDD